MIKSETKVKLKRNTFLFYVNFSLFFITEHSFFGVKMKKKIN